MKKLLLLLCLPISVFAAPLPDETRLSITMGSGEGPNIPCNVGSCFGMEVAAGFVVWTSFGAGTDGGFVVGRSQLSGGQETGPSSAIKTSGSLTTAWLFFGNYGTFFTDPDGATNIFDDAGCIQAGCSGKTALKVFNVAWNGNVIPMGSAAGCSLPACTDDQKAGISIKEWTISGGQWSIDHSQVVPDGQFQGVKFQALMLGSVTLPTSTQANAGPDQKDKRIGNLIELSGTCTETAPGKVITSCEWSGPDFLIDKTNPTSFVATSDGNFTFTLCAVGVVTSCDNMTVFVQAERAVIQTSTSGCSLGQGQSDYAWLLIAGFLVVLGSKRLI